ncbi:MAG: hypothetical protein AXA67_01475 [Methylothermaceae bacteria B42]|nr:MAG: hypothetical protein AXA67_01475 [Methylothermaceae bacteria B42]HHJ39051.1 hypothetical protein [Methylothermaceae bacterium]
MEKTTLRIILAVAGVLLILGIYLWDRWKRHKKALDQEFADLDADITWEDDFEPEEVDTISLNPMEESASPDSEVLENQQLAGEEPPPSEEPAEPAPPPPEPAPAKKESKTALPEVIQVSIAAPDGETFQGIALLKAFQDLGLKHGEMDIFHFYQGENIQFSVASLVKPGIFPAEDMENFSTPGITLFFQPALVNDPEATFDRMMHTCHALAKRLGGSEWDDRRQPLSASKISAWRWLLRGAR